MKEVVEQAIAEAEKLHGWMAHDELEWLAETALGKHRIIEVGSWKGRSTKVLGRLTPGRVFCVDSWKWAPGGGDTEAVYHCFLKNMAPEIRSGKIFVLRMTSLEAAVCLKDILGSHPADMVFIDSDHTYKSLRNEIQAYLPLLGPEGIISGHDFNQVAVKKAVEELLPGTRIAQHSIWEFIKPKAS